VPQRRAFNKEKKRLDYVIRDKKVANGSLVPVIECQEEKIIPGGFLALKAESK
jgi:hypothetical protein